MWVNHYSHENNFQWWSWNSWFPLLKKVARRIPIIYHPAFDCSIYFLNQKHQHFHSFALLLFGLFWYFSWLEAASLVELVCLICFHFYPLGCLFIEPSLWDVLLGKSWSLFNNSNVHLDHGFSSNNSQSFSIIYYKSGIHWNDCQSSP